MFYTPPSLFDPPTYPRKKLPLAGSPPEQARFQPQPEPTAKVPYRPAEQASPRPPGNAIPLIFRALAHPSLRRPKAAAAAYSDSFPALQSQTQPASAPAPFQSPAQPPQTPPTASPATQSTEEAPKAAPAFQEAAAHVEADSTLRDQSPTATAAAGQQLSTKPTDSTPLSPSQPLSTPAPAQSPTQPQQTPPTASPAPQSTEEAPKVAAPFKKAAAPQPPTAPAPPAPQSPSQSPAPPAPPQPPAPPPQAPPTAPTAAADSEDEPKVVEALKQAAAEVEADTARQKRDAQLAELEANGMADHAKSLRELDAEMAQRRADLEKKHPQHGAQYEASMRELEKEKEARQAPVMNKVQAIKAIDRGDNLRRAKIVVSRENKLPQTRGKTEEQKQAEWKAQMERVGLDPNNHEHVSAYWDAKRLHYLNDGRYAKYDWDGSTPKREGFGSAVLSDGSLHVAPEFIHDDKKYAAVVAASGASEEEKARAMADLPRLQQAYAEAMLPILKQAGSTRAAQWIPGIASFQKWQAEKPRQGSEAEQANEYLKEMNQRGLWSKATDNVLRNLLVGFGNMGTMAAGLAGMVGVPGASETAAEWSKRGSDFLAPISAEGGNSGTASAVFGHVAGMIGPMAASLLLTRGLGGGIKTMSAISGAQTAGSQYAETYGQLREEGKTHAQAWLATAPFALASGLATAFLTAAGGATGFEAALSTKAGTQTAKDAAQGFWKNLLLNVPKHALADIPQELPDELFSQMMSALATNHDADLGKVAADFIHHAPELMGAIALMGGAGGAMKTRQDARNSPEQTHVDASEDENTLDETKQTPSSEQTIPDSTTSNKIPSFEEALAASQTIEKLKAQKTPLSLEQQQELDAAEKTFAKRTEANILAQKATLEARGEKIHPTTAAALAKAQAMLARPAPRDRGPLPTIPDARKTIQDLSSKAAAGTLNADEAHQMAHAQRAIAQQRVNDLKALGTAITPQQQRQLNRFEEILNASPYGTELPKGPPPGYDPHATNPAHREWHPPHGDKPAHPPDNRFTTDALALSKNEIKTTTESLKAKGHAHDRHGPEVTEGQLSDRAMHGIDPITQTREDGERSRNDHNYSRHATQFTSERAMTQAVKSVESSAEYTDELNKAEKEGKDRFTVKNVSLESALGPNYQEHVRGRTRTGSAANPSGSRPTNLTDGNFIAQYKRDPATGKFYLNTIFANPSLTHEPN